jgi:hypothetical protein
MQKFSEYINEKQDMDSVFKKVKNKIIKDIKQAELSGGDIIQAAKDDLGEYMSSINPISSKEKTWFGKESFEEAEDYFYDKLEVFAKLIVKEV